MSCLCDDVTLCLAWLCLLGGPLAGGGMLVVCLAAAGVSLLLGGVTPKTRNFKNFEYMYKYFMI